MTSRAPHLDEAPERDRDAEEVLDQLLDPALAHPVGAAAHGHDRLQTRPEVAGWHPWRQGGARGDAAPRAVERMELVLLHEGRDLGDVDDLMAVGIGVVALQGAAATTARLRLEHLGLCNLLGRHQCARLLVMAGLPAALSSRPLRRCGRRRPRGIGGGRARRVARERGQPRFQVPNPLFQGRDRGLLHAYDRLKLLDAVVSPIAPHDRRTICAGAPDASKLASSADQYLCPGRERLLLVFQSASNLSGLSS